MNYRPESLEKSDEIGLVNGLAWTSVGGETMQIEVASLEGSGKIVLTGSLGEVMKESAQTAVSCVRARASWLNLDAEFYKNKDIHIHAPEGAVPKDGPSAGIAMATALVSALTDTPVRRDVAMTGEITLRGRVLPIGGLKEKTMAAYRAGIRAVLVPEDDTADLSEIDPVVREALEFIPGKNGRSGMGDCAGKRPLSPSGRIGRRRFRIDRAADCAFASGHHQLILGAFGHI